MPPKGASKTKQSAAAAKRKADDDSGDDAGEGPSKGPKETQGQRDERLLKEKTDPYYRPAAERDNTDEVQQSLPPTAPSDQWVNILAVHLASESAFIDYMKNPGDLSDVIISNQWLASVYLPGRTTYWPAFKNWYARWWAVGKRQPNGHRFKVLARASQIVADCMLPGQSSIKGTIAPLPENDDKTAGLRQNLFQIHATHSKLKELTRNLTDNQHGLSVALVDILHRAIDDTTSGDRDDLVKELTALDTVKSSAKEVLMKSRFNDTGLKLLDDFLELVPEHDKCGILSELNKGEQFPIFASVIASHAEPESQLAEEFVKGYEEIAAEIREKHQIKIDFLADKELNKGNPKDVCHVRSSGKRFGNVQTSKPLKNESIASKGMLGLIEQECSKWLSKMAEKFDKKRFELNFRDFESLTTRPDGCANASIGSSYWIRKHNHLEIARDNIVHVRRLVSHLRANNMISDEEALQKVLRRMYAFLALMHGCVAEGAIMLTVMDRLLEDLASVIIGNLDPKLESEKMQRAMTVIHEQTAERKAKLNMNDQMRHEREHKAREVFAEIVRFYHGAVILLFSAASAGKSDQAENQTVLWYQGIIDLSSKCGNSKCADQLEVKKIAKVTDTSSERWALSIAVKDARIGFPEERSMVSTNRKFTYPCLYDIVMGRRYHVAYAPFFHYFAHLWHPACRAFRGKGGLLDDMLEFEGTQEAQTQAPSNDDDEMLLGWCASP